MWEILKEFITFGNVDNKLIKKHVKMVVSIGTELEIKLTYIEHPKYS